jgi:tetratricopeptide (TPR) repeat protein
MPVTMAIDPADSARLAELRKMGAPIPNLSKIGPHVAKGNDLKLAERFGACVANDTCACCGRKESDGVKFKRCGKCLDKQLIPALFCSEGCHKKAWPEHKQWHRAQKKLHAEQLDQLQQPDKKADLSEQLDLTSRFAQQGDRASELLARGMLYLDSQDYFKAAQQFRKCIELAPRLPEAYFNLGLAYERCNNDRQAFEMFLAAADRHDLGTVKWADSVAAGFEKLTFCLLEGKSVARPKWWNDRELRKLSKQVVKASHGEGPLKMRVETISCSGQFWEARGSTRSREELEEAASIYQRLGKIIMERGNKDGARTMIENGTSARSGAMKLADKGPGAVVILEVIDGVMQFCLGTFSDDAHEQAARQMRPAERRREAKLVAKHFVEQQRSKMTDDDLNQTFIFFDCKEEIPANARKVIEIGPCDAAPHGGYMVRLADAPPLVHLDE